MTDQTNVASATEADAPAPLKSTDTSVVNKMKSEEVAAAPEQDSAVTEEAKVEETTEHDPEGVETDTPEVDSEDKPKPGRNSWKKRLERVRQATQAETRAAVLQELIEKGVIKPPESRPTAGESSGEKSLADFDYDQDAFIEWKLDQKLKKRDEQQREEEGKKRQAEAAEQFQAKVTEFEKRAGEGAWEEVMSSPINLDPAFKPLAEMIEGDASALDIAYFFATHPDKAEEIVGLSPLKMALEVAKIAEQIGGKQQEKPAPALPKKTTNAPPPPKTVTGSGRPSVDVFDPNLTTEQRIAMWRRKG